jgi:DNA-directed RNA polymerase specialized sigma24 family protein
MAKDATMRKAMRDTGFREHVVSELEVLLRVARRLTGNSVTAEVLVQEALIGRTVPWAASTVVIPAPGC